LCSATSTPAPDGTHPATQALPVVGERVVGERVVGERGVGERGDGEGGGNPSGYADVTPLGDWG
jgi:hypothetical protein